MPLPVSASLPLFLHRFSAYLPLSSQSFSSSIQSLLLFLHPVSTSLPSSSQSFSSSIHSLLFFLHPVSASLPSYSQSFSSSIQSLLLFLHPVSASLPPSSHCFSSSIRSLLLFLHPLIASIPPSSQCVSSSIQSLLLFLHPVTASLPPPRHCFFFLHPVSVSLFPSSQCFCSSIQSLLLFLHPGGFSLCQLFLHPFRSSFIHEIFSTFIQSAILSSLFHPASSFIVILFFLHPEISFFNHSALLASTPLFLQPFRSNFILSVLLFLQHVSASLPPSGLSSSVPSFLFFISNINSSVFINVFLHHSFDSFSFISSNNYHTYFSIFSFLPTSSVSNPLYVWSCMAHLHPLPT